MRAGGIAWRRAGGMLLGLLAAAATALGETAEPQNKTEETERSWTLKPKGEFEAWVFHQSHPFFGRTSRFWSETNGRFGLVLTYDHVKIEAQTLGVKTWGDDPYGTGTPPAGLDRGARSRSTAPDFELDQLYLQVAQLGGLPLEVTIGRQNLKVGTEFLFGDGVFDGFTPGTMQGVYSSPRHYVDAVRIRSDAFGNQLDAFVFRVDPTWDSGFGDDGIIGGAELARKFEAIGGTYALGAFYRASHSSKENDELILDSRVEQPLPWLSGSYVSGEAAGEIGKCRSAFYCNEPDGHSMREYAWHAETGIKADDVRWKPFLEVGYVYFSTDFAPVNYGFHDWGKWYLGNQIDWMIYDTNSKIIRTDMGFWPLETVQARFLYYNTREVTPSHESSGGTVTDEFTWVFSWYPNETFWALVSVGYSIPREAFEKAEFENPFSFVNSGAAGVGDQSSVDITTAFGIHF